jgi:hypothetical protein
LPTARVSESEGAPVKNVEYKNGSFSRVNAKGVRFGVKVKDVLAMLHTPSGQEPGVSHERLQTKNGKPMKIGERAYDKETGRLAQVGLPQQIGAGTGLKLQPAFVEYLMGFPQDWTRL